MAELQREYASEHAIEDVLHSQPPGLLSVFTLAPEIVQQVLGFLGISDLLHVAQTCKALRVLATDPVLHHRRLKAVKPALLSALTARPSRADLLARRTILLSLHPHQPAMYIHGAAQVAQIQAYLALSRLLTSHKLRRGIERRATLRSLTQAGVVDLEVEKGKISASLVPAMRALKKAQKTDSLRRGMRADEANSWKTPVEVIDSARGIWREDDPRVVSAVVSEST